MHVLFWTLHDNNTITIVGITIKYTNFNISRVGRKPTIIACAIGGTVGLFKIFITNYYVYITVEFLESVLASGLYTVGVVLCTYLFTFYVNYTFVYVYFL